MIDCYIHSLLFRQSKMGTGLSLINNLQKVCLYESLIEVLGKTK